MYDFSLVIARFCWLSEIMEATLRDKINNTVQENIVKTLTKDIDNRLHLIISFERKWRIAFLVLLPFNVIFHSSHANE